ncbi:palmitoyl-protein thioesterase [Salix suchowensis]|nr:palmitoyl-protein thioesterase [Salix suchowensis]
MHPPTDILAYLTGFRFLPKLNNEINNTRNSAYNEWFTVSIPKKISRSGYYPDESFYNVFLAQETWLYIEDWIGLKNLDEAQQFHLIIDFQQSRTSPWR